MAKKKSIHEGIIHHISREPLFCFYLGFFYLEGGGVEVVWRVLGARGICFPSFQFTIKSLSMTIFFISFRGWVIISQPIPLLGIQLLVTRTTSCIGHHNVTPLVIGSEISWLGVTNDIVISWVLLPQDEKGGCCEFHGLYLV